VKTATTPAKLALRYRVPIVPLRVRRESGARFRITVYPQIDAERLGDDEDGVMEITALINKTLEDWVREDPAQWHWIHRRWPDSIK
jgi:KDO2-lipid IV(A) lauroyltransferase